MKKKKDNNRTLRNFFSPYLNKGNSMHLWFDAYENDEEKRIVLDGKAYSKIIYRCELYGREESMLIIALEPQEEMLIGDIVIDELGREFEIKGFSMFRFAGDVPKWARKISPIEIKGNNYEIGNYIAMK